MTSAPRLEAPAPSAVRGTRAGRLKRAQSWLDGEYHISDEQLGFARVLYCVFVLLVIGVPSFTWIADTPKLLFDPPPFSAANLLSNWPSGAVLSGLSLALVVLFLLLLFGLFVPVVSVLLSATLIAGLNLQYSFGKIDHNALLLALTPLVMARSGWGNRYTLNGRGSATNRSGRCLGIFAVIIGFAMFTAGYQKLTTGWLDARAHASYGHMIDSFYSDARNGLLAPMSIRVRSGLAWESLDYLTVAFELTFLIAVTRRWVFQAWVAFALIFHTGTLLVLNIGFAPNFAAYLLFFEWPLPRKAIPLRTWRLLAAGGSIVVLGVWWLSIGSTQHLFLRMSPSLTNYLVTRSVGAANVNDTTLDILPTCLAVAASAMLVVRRKKKRA